MEGVNRKNTFRRGDETFSKYVRCNDLSVPFVVILPSLVNDRIEVVLDKRRLMSWSTFLSRTRFKAIIFGLV